MRIKKTASQVSRLSLVFKLDFKNYIGVFTCKQKVENNELWSRKSEKNKQKLAANFILW